MDLQDVRILRDNWRNDGDLEWSGRGNDTVGLDHAVRRLDTESGPADIFLHELDLDAAADRRIDLLCVGDKIVGDLVLRGKTIGTYPRKLHAREPIMPGRAVGNQGVPPLRTPALGNPTAFENEMRHPAFAQMLAHSHPRLPATDDKRVNSLNRHAHSFSDHSTASAVG